MGNPASRWSGDAYFDHNAGQSPLERSFRSWTWSRARLRDRTAIFYDLQRRDQDDLSVALEARSDGSLVEMDDPPPAANVSPTLWRLPRATRVDPGAVPRVLRTIEDGPFYARSLLSAKIGGEQSGVMQETLSLDRLRQAWIRYLVLYRNPRAVSRSRPTGN